MSIVYLMPCSRVGWGGEGREGDEHSVPDAMQQSGMGRRGSSGRNRRERGETKY